MSLKLGKSFNRNYTIQVPIMDGYYNIGIYFDKKSTFLLFKAEADFKNTMFKHNIKINMFKNLESSKFCETFIDLHNFRKNTLDIVNQFKKIKDNYTHNISFVLNETIILSKIYLEDKNVYDTLNIYGMTINGFNEEFIFIITERQNVLKRLGKKIVRTSGIQIATTPALNMLSDYHQESKKYSQNIKPFHTNPNKIINFKKEEIKNTQHI
jgi:hypothetical protein